MTGTKNDDDCSPRQNTLRRHQSGGVGESARARRRSALGRGDATVCRDGIIAVSNNSTNRPTSALTPQASPADSDYAWGCLNAESFAPSHAFALEHVSCAMHAGGPLLAMALLHYISDEGRRPIVMVGDSMTRQLFNRLVHHMRFGGVSVGSDGPFVKRMASGDRRKNASSSQSVPPPSTAASAAEGESDDPMIRRRSDDLVHATANYSTASSPPCVPRARFPPFLHATSSLSPSLKGPVAAACRRIDHRDDPFPILSVLPSELPPSFTDVPYYESDRYARHRYYVLRGEGGVDEVRYFPDPFNKGMASLALAPNCRPSRRRRRIGEVGDRLPEMTSDADGDDDKKGVVGSSSATSPTMGFDKGTTSSSESSVIVHRQQNGPRRRNNTEEEEAGDCLFMIQFVWAPAEKPLHFPTFFRRVVKPHDTSDDWPNATLLVHRRGGVESTTAHRQQRRGGLQEREEEATTSAAIMDVVMPPGTTAAATGRRIDGLLPATQLPALLITGFHYWSAIPLHSRGANFLPAAAMAAATHAWFDVVDAMQEDAAALSWDALGPPHGRRINGTLPLRQQEASDEPPTPSSSWRDAVEGEWPPPSAAQFHYIHLTTPLKSDAREDVLRSRDEVARERVQRLAQEAASLSARRFESSRKRPRRRYGEETEEKEGDISLRPPPPWLSANVVDLQSIAASYPRHLQQAMLNAGMDGHFQCMFAQPSAEGGQSALFESGLKCRDDVNGGSLRVVLNVLTAELRRRMS